MDPKNLEFKIVARSVDLSSRNWTDIPTEILDKLIKNKEKYDKLNISRNYLKFIPSEILSGLKEIDLSQNYLSEIPTGWEEETIILNLSSNKIKDLKFAKSSQKIQTLIIPYNYITKIKSDSLIGFSNLYCLDLESNYITEIENGAFDHIPNLSTLLLNGSNLIQKIEEGLFKNINPTNLKLNQNLLTYPTDIHPDEFDHMTNLFKLNLSGHQTLRMSDEKIKSLKSLHIYTCYSRK